MSIRMHKSCQENGCAILRRYVDGGGGDRTSESYAAGQWYALSRHLEDVDQAILSSQSKGATQGLRAAYFLAKLRRQAVHDLMIENGWRIPD